MSFKFYVNGALQTGMVTESYAEIHLHDAVASQEIASGATYTKLTLFTDNGASSDCVSDVANDKIIINTAGTYRVDGSFNMSSGTGNVVYEIGAFLGGVEQDNIHLQRKVSTAGDVGSASFTGFIQVTTVPVDLDVRVAHDNGGAVDLTVTYANFNLSHI